jgi:hypothetical protein
MYPDVVCSCLKMASLFKAKVDRKTENIIDLRIIKKEKKECLHKITKKYDVTEFEINMDTYIQKKRDFEEELAEWKDTKRLMLMKNLEEKWIMKKRPKKKKDNEKLSEITLNEKIPEAKSVEEKICPKMKEENTRENSVQNENLLVVDSDKIISNKEEKERIDEEAANEINDLG